MLIFTRKKTVELFMNSCLPLAHFIFEMFSKSYKLRQNLNTKKKKTFVIVVGGLIEQSLKNQNI